MRGAVVNGSFRRSRANCLQLQSSCLQEPRSRPASSCMSLSTSYSSAFALTPVAAASRQCFVVPAPAAAAEAAVCLNGAQGSPLESVGTDKLCGFKRAAPTLPPHGGPSDSDAERVSVGASRCSSSAAAASLRVHVDDHGDMACGFRSCEYPVRRDGRSPALTATSTLSSAFLSFTCCSLFRVFLASLYARLSTLLSGSALCAFFARSYS